MDDEIGVDLRMECFEHLPVAVLAVSGDLDAATAPKLHRRLEDLIDHGHRYITVDLSGVRFLASAGLGVLIRALHQVRHHDGDLVLVCSQTHLRKAFETTGLDRVFDIHTTSDDAATA